MTPELRAETTNLIQSWERHDKAMLQDYLVQGVEDPRINVQSILTRHFLAFAAFGPRFVALADAELRFAAAMNWLLSVSQDPDLDPSALIHAIERRSDNCEGIDIPFMIRQLHVELPTASSALGFPNYLRSTLSTAAESGRLAWPCPALDTFAEAWQHALSPLPPEAITVLEPACGSANDYRFLLRFGLSRHIEYTGFDLSAKNIANAREAYKSARFEVGNAFEIPHADRAFDFCFVHDLFEHLSLEGMERAAKEVCRVTRKGLCLHFFQMAEIPEHVVRPVEDYHWNLLSVDRCRDLFEGLGFRAQILHIGSFLRDRAGCSTTHNQDAYTIVLAREDAG